MCWSETIYYKLSSERCKTDTKKKKWKTYQSLIWHCRSQYLANLHLLHSSSTDLSLVAWHPKHVPSFLIDLAFFRRSLAQGHDTSFAKVLASPLSVWMSRPYLEIFSISRSHAFFGMYRYRRLVARTKRRRITFCGFWNGMSELSVLTVAIKYWWMQLA